MTGFPFPQSRALSRMVIAMLAGLLLAACDPQAINELEEGVSTEADVRQRFGAPEAVWDGPDGAQIYEYNRQPAGHVNYMITVGADGKMSALRQVLTPQNFARIQPSSVRRITTGDTKMAPTPATPKSSPWCSTATSRWCPPAR